MMPDHNPFASPLHRGAPLLFYAEPIRSGRLAASSLAAGLLAVAWPIAVAVMAFMPPTMFIAWALSYSGIAVAVEGVFCLAAVSCATLALIKIREGTDRGRAAALGGLMLGTLSLLFLAAVGFWLLRG